MESIALTEAVFYILLSLDEPLHGYGIMQNAERLSNGRVRLAAGTLYGALDTLQETALDRAGARRRVGAQEGVPVDGRRPRCGCGWSSTGCASWWETARRSWGGWSA